MTQIHSFLNNFYCKIIFFCFFGMLMSCHTTKKVQTGVIKKQNVTELLSILDKNQIKYQNFAASAQITITQPDETRTINAKIRLKKDSVIWLSASLFGIEGARAILTPDSVKILNRLEQTYIAAPFSYFQKKYNVPLNFSSLQNILVGNVPDLNVAGFRATQDTLNYLLIKGLDAEQMQYTLDGRTQ